MPLLPHGFGDVLFTVFAVFIFFLVRVGHSQFRDGTPAYQQLMGKNEEMLSSQLKQNEREIDIYYTPKNADLPSDSYIIREPKPTDYRLNILLEPCMDLPYDCCMNTFGSPEYGKLKRDGLEPERVFKKNVLANSTDVFVNFDLIYEDSLPILKSASLLPDNEDYTDPECMGPNIPYSRCRGRNWGQRISSNRPGCLDNNQTVNALKGCQDPVTGEDMPTCVQVGYSSTAFIPQCNENWIDPLHPHHCGTFLEIHAPKVPFTDHLSFFVLLLLCSPCFFMLIPSVLLR